MRERFREWHMDPKSRKSMKTFCSVYAQLEQEMPALFQKFTKLDTVDPRQWWRTEAMYNWRDMEEHFEREDELAKLILPHTDGYPYHDIIAKTVLFMRIMFSVRRAVGPIEGDTSLVVQDLSIHEAIAKYINDVRDSHRYKTVFGVSGPAKRMFLSDLRDYKDQPNIAEKIICRAKNRIYMQLRGAGGFIVSCAGRKFELSSRGDGCSGLYYREFVLSESYEVSEEKETGVSVTAGVEVGYLCFSFSASIEASMSQTNGWSMTTEENPTEWKRIKEKSFLDGLSWGTSSLGRLALMMNWYLGGLDEWYSTSKTSDFGCLMKEDPIDLRSLTYLEAFKVDSHFTEGELASVTRSECPADLSQTPFHSQKGRDAHGELLYERSNPGPKVKITGFVPDDSKAALGRLSDQGYETPAVPPVEEIKELRQINFGRKALPGYDSFDVAVWGDRFAGSGSGHQGPQYADIFIPVPGQACPVGKFSGPCKVSVGLSEAYFSLPRHRVMSIKVGNRLMDGIDIVKESGKYHPLIKTFDSVEPDSDGNIVFTFNASVNLATVCWLSIEEI